MNNISWNLFPSIIFGQTFNMLGQNGTFRCDGKVVVNNMSMICFYLKLFRSILKLIAGPKPLACFHISDIKN